MGNSVDIDREEGKMRATRTLRQSGGSIVLTMPRELLDNVGFEDGDELVLEADMLGDELTVSAIDVEDGD